jgi:hypothetical protein
MGWPPSIAINNKGQRTKLVVNHGARILVTRPYPNYKKNVDPDVHVRVFNVTVRTNGETYEEYIINAFSYTLKKMASYRCHIYMLEFLDYKFSKLM